MPTYNKLVRDLIPEIIEKTGKTFRTRTLNDDEYITELKQKFQEEVNEYMEATDNNEAVEELADVLEIIHALAAVHGSTIDEIDTVRARKEKERGGFKDKVFLIDVPDE